MIRCQLGHLGKFSCKLHTPSANLTQGTPSQNLPFRSSANRVLWEQYNFVMVQRPPFKQLSAFCSCFQYHRLLYLLAEQENTKQGLALQHGIYDHFLGYQYPQGCSVSVSLSCLTWNPTLRKQQKTAGGLGNVGDPQEALGFDLQPASDLAIAAMTE